METLPPFFSIIVAVDQEGGIGRGGTIPWHLSGDLRRFKKLTTVTHVPGRKNAVMMGRKTWESLPPVQRPLPQRMNVVLSRQHDLSLPEGVFGFKSFETAWYQLTQGDLTSLVENIFVIGGGEVYRQALDHPQCRKIYLTKICASYQCDNFFPSLEGKFKQEYVSPVYLENQLNFCFMEFGKQV